MFVSPMWFRFWHFTIFSLLLQSGLFNLQPLFFYGQPFLAFLLAVIDTCIVVPWDVTRVVRLVLVIHPPHRYYHPRLHCSPLGHLLQFHSMSFSQSLHTGKNSADCQNHPLSIPSTAMGPRISYSPSWISRAGCPLLRFYDSAVGDALPVSWPASPVLPLF